MQSYQGPPGEVTEGVYCLSRQSLWAYVAGLAGSKDWAEFGVRKGKSARALLDLLPDDGTLSLFDSWTGLPEAWVRSDDESIDVGGLACQEPDIQDPRAFKYRGLFADTLPEWESTMPEVGLVHLDCDLYSSTLDVLRALERPGVMADACVVIFDDLFGYPNWRQGQWAAWDLMRGVWDFEWIARTWKGQAAVKLYRRW